MTDSATNPGRRNSMKQAATVAGGVAAGCAGSAAGDHAALAAADDTRVATPDKPSSTRAPGGCAASRAMASTSGTARP